MYAWALWALGRGGSSLSMFGRHLLFFFGLIDGGECSHPVVRAFIQTDDS